MRRSIFTWLAVMLVLLVTSGSTLQAANYTTAPTAVTSSSWTDLGFGPLRLQVLSQRVYVYEADAAPSASTKGEVYAVGTYNIGTSHHVFVRAVADSASIVASTYNVTIGVDKMVSVTPTVQNAAYSASNAIGGTQSVALLRSNGGSGILNSVRLISKGGATQAVTLYATTKTPSWTCTDKSAFAEAAADIPYYVPGFPIVLSPSVPQGGTFSSSSSQPMTSVQNQDTSPGQNLYFCAVVNGSVTPATTSDLTFIYNMIQD